MSETKEVKLSAEEQTLYNRQLYAIGAEAQGKISKGKVLIVGLKGLGVEVAKNVILAGIGSCGIYDPGAAELADLGSQFYLSEADVGKPRGEACLSKLIELNKFCKVHAAADLSEETLKQYTVVCVTDQSIPELIKLNNICHANGIKFVSGDVRGLLASVFVDFGDSHVVVDLDGERPKRALIANISNEEKGLVTMAEDVRHDLQDGDFVHFDEVEGMVEVNDEKKVFKVRVQSPFTFTVGDTSGFSKYSGSGGYFQQVKLPTELKFKTLESLLEGGQGDLPICSEQWGRTRSLHVLSLALSEFQGKHDGALPKPDSAADTVEVVALAQAIATKKDIELDAKLVGNLARVSASVINPMTAFLGGIVGQEVLKAASFKFTPIQQFFYFDAEQVLPTSPKTADGEEGEEIPLTEFAPQNTRYDHQIGIIGKTLHNKLTAGSYFLIGSGAIGCEMLKNWALMGVATDSKQGGKITVTDMDVIETSNLSRQFLFRNKDVGSLKSNTAAAAIKAMNPDVNIEAHKLCVGLDTETTYNDNFWESLEMAVTALDNVKARLYVDQRCVLFRKPLLDSGTLGTKGNTQCVIPDLTEAYGSSTDPPEQSIPVCTLKNFPHKIEHTIAWSRSKFEGFFTQQAQEVNSYITEADYLTELAKSPNEELQTLEKIKQALVTDKPTTIQDCIAWGRLLFEAEYNNAIQQLLLVYPADKVDESGNKFWSGAKRVPKPVEFDIKDDLHLDFVVAAANLLAFNFNIEQTTDRAVFRAHIPTVTIEPFVPSGNVKIAATEEEAKELAKAAVSDDHDTQVASVVAELPKPEALSDFKLQVVDFEKDDDTNFHMDFITACSNLRARNYSIKEESKHQTKFIAGKIIPAIATTTAMVTGLVCLEMYKAIQDNTILDDYRNAFANLALSIFVFGEPFAPPKIEVRATEEKKFTFTLWDKIAVKGPKTLEQFKTDFEAEYSLTFDSLFAENTSLFSPFLAAKKKKKALGKKIEKLYTKTTGNDLPASSKYISLNVVAFNDEGEQVEIPQVRYQFRD